MKIDRLQLINFKCLSNVTFEFGNLNILAGANGCGKSSLIHALLLLRQSYEQYRNLNKLLLSGKYVNLGSAKDLLYEHAEKNEEISYKIFNEKNEKLELFYEYIPENRILNILQHRDYNLKDLNIFGDAFEYLSAERIVPQTTYSSISQDDLLGSHGENALNFLEKYGATFKVEKIFQDETKNEYLLYYINKWMERIFQGFRLQLSPIAEADAVGLRYAEKSRDRVSNSYRAINVGFGITYVLPILVALLKAKKNDLILIENPEAHLHPKAQRIIGELLAKAASTGAQVIVETHSDHILNGIRISAKNKMINPTDVKMFFFMKEDVGTKYHTNIYSPQMDDEGNIDIWPDGFFDEWDNALAQLF